MSGKMSNKSPVSHVRRLTIVSLFFFFTIACLAHFCFVLLILLTLPKNVKLFLAQADVISSQELGHRALHAWWVSVSQPTTELLTELVHAFSLASKHAFLALS